MQLELVLADPPAVVQALWDQFDPVQREALIQRLAQVITKTAVAPVVDEENDDE